MTPDKTARIRAALEAVITAQNLGNFNENGFSWNGQLLHPHLRTIEEALLQPENVGGDFIEKSVKDFIGNSNYWTGSSKTVFDVIIHSVKTILSRSGHLASPSIPARDEWQTMESAPRDGTEFLAVIRGCETGKIKRVPLSYSEDGWIFDGEELSYAWDVTRWMPLPDLPPPPKENDDVG